MSREYLAVSFDTTEHSDLLIRLRSYNGLSSPVARSAIRRARPVTDSRDLLGYNGNLGDSEVQAKLMLNPDPENIIFFCIFFRDP